MEENIMTLVGSLGFPIVCCFFMWKYINETMKEFTAKIEANTLALTTLCERLTSKIEVIAGDDDDE
jgi:hypothetical protein